MDKNSTILISGAGIAGLTCAIWLGRHGFRPVVIEKSPTIRADGFVISLSHASYRYAAQLDLLAKIQAMETGIRESRYHDRRGRAMLTLDFRDLFAGVDVLQIMRDDLQQILHDEVQGLAEIRLATSATTIEQQGDRAVVTFNDGRSEEFDVVVGADGLHSNTRGLSFPDQEVSKRYLGLFSSAYRLPNVIDMRERFENHMERSRYMCVYSTRDDDLACAFIWQSDKAAAPPPEERLSELQAQFRGSPTLVRKVLEAFPQEQTVYMDPLIQIEMKRWCEGNVVLLGDAAHCLTLLSGQGASSAFWGACSLAKGLVSQSKADAFSNYENALRPVIAEIQPATRLAAKWYVPRTQTRYVIRDAAMRYLPNSFYQRYFKQKYAKA
jgi:2-polyprenyl-6-methoxyphenol hydroxylase-like FAD-dependent oxidoreductase